MADAGTSLGVGHEEQKSQHGKLREAGMGLERVKPCLPFQRRRPTDNSIPCTLFLVRFPPLYLSPSPHHPLIMHRIYYGLSLRLQVAGPWFDQDVKRKAYE